MSGHVWKFPDLIHGFDSIQSQMHVMLQLSANAVYLDWLVDSEMIVDLMNNNSVNRVLSDSVSLLDYALHVHA